MLQKTQVSVQPLLDEVMASGKEKGKVMGSVRLEDIEADVAKDSDISTETESSNEKKNKEIVGDGDDEMLDSQVKMEAFNRLVEKMKTSGTLPEKPQPAVRVHRVYITTWEMLFFKTPCGPFKKKCQKVSNQSASLGFNNCWQQIHTCTLLLH